MFVSDCLQVNGHGHLTIGGRDTVELAQTFGTPLYVMDETEIRESCRRYKRSMDLFYGGNGLVCYASKAFLCKEMCRIIEQEGLGLDVVSGGELYTAISAGFPLDKVLFHGNNKTPEELVYAVESGVGRIVVDNIFELELLEQVAAAADTQVHIQLRIKPGVEAHTHSFVQTGQIDSKFGLALQNGEAIEAVRRAISLPHLDLVGVHCHIGSQIFDIAPFELAAERLLGLLAEVRNELGYVIAELNLGGGYGIRYLPEHDPVAYDRYMERIAQVVHERCAALELETPFVLMEPGRSIAGPAGITLYQIGGVKEIPGVRTYLSVDGGMGDNPRYALYGSEYEMLVANKASQPKQAVYTVAGRCCESGDLLGADTPLQEAAPGDILAVLATGAYNYSMASNYNRLPRPAVVLVNDGEAKVIVKRESYEDLIRLDV